MSSFHTYHYPNSPIRGERRLVLLYLRWFRGPLRSLSATVRPMYAPTAVPTIPPVSAMSMKGASPPAPEG